MLRNYLTVAFRNLLRYKVYSFINISGLALAIGCCLLIFLFVWNEWTYDTFHENADRIYRVYEKDDDALLSRFSAQIDISIGPVLEEQCADVEQAVRMVTDHEIIEHEGKPLGERQLFADPEILTAFSFPLAEGDPTTALKFPYSVVLTQETAKRYFGTENPLGKTIVIPFFYDEEFYDCTVTGIAEDIPKNSSIQFDILLPYEAIENVHPDIHRWGRRSLYVQLADGVEADNLEVQFPTFVKEQLKEHLEANTVSGSLHLQPLRDIHFGGMTNASTLFGGLKGNAAYPYILLGIGFLIVVLVIANFSNLAIAGVSTRAREIGVRKVLGADRRQLMRQFWMEAILTSAIALIFGLGLAELFLPAFNALMQRELEILYTRFDTLVAVLILPLSIGLIAGSYPAIFLSNLQPAKIVKDTLKIGGKSPFSRGLIALQFSLCIFLVIVMMGITRQLDFLKSKNLGMDAEQLVSLPVHGRELLDLFKNELAGQESIAGVAGAWPGPGPGAGAAPRNLLVEGEKIKVFKFWVDYDYLKTVGMELAAGRNFAREFSTDATEGVLINQTLADQLGWDHPVGRELKEIETSGQRHFRIIGVVEDFHFTSLRHSVSPAVLHLTDWENGHIFLTVKIRPGHIPVAMALLEETWSRLMSDEVFRYEFVDEEFDALYREEERWERIIRFAAGFAIFIACLGTFGLVSLAVARRTKEIGIRKVLGASVTDIVSLLSREFVILVIVANLFAWPAAYSAVQRWLQDFAYRIDLGPGIFVLGGVLTLAIVLLTVGTQAIKSALSNPVDALRYE
ncbi:MAG: FtsX-like permease family protein [Gemmatimonadetes bacterium]|jgi:putative ABC transport system permease protein|nr:FtsX-like permease family protein [Gemmatimonadota bacterium]